MICWLIILVQGKLDRVPQIANSHLQCWDRALFSVNTSVSMIFSYLNTTDFSSSFKTTLDDIYVTQKLNLGCLSSLRAELQGNSW